MMSACAESREARSSTEFRVLVLAPTARDAEVAARLLAEFAITAEQCSSQLGFAAEFARGAGVLVMTNDLARSDSLLQAVRHCLKSQPEWSEIPVICLARPGTTPEAQELRELPGVVLVDRPVQARPFVSAVQAGLRARARQYQIRDQLTQIQAKNAELEESTSAKDEFLATLSHELRNPLSAMLSASTLLERAHGDERKTALARSTMKRQIQQMSRLLDDLLDIARMTRGRFELRKHRVDLDEILKTALDASRPGIEQRQHELVVSTPMEQISLDADPVRISQVIANLLTNASKYTDRHGRISLDVEPVGGSVQIRVQDSGIGIPEDSLTSIFGMFSQLRPALERSEGGLGIGLALAKRIVELHGGTIEARSDGAGRGSEFRVTLPVAGENAERNREVACQSQSTRQCAILVADDNDDGLSSLASLLAMEGHTVYEARDGLGALRIAQTSKLDAALLDIGMPGMNGYDVARHIRASPSNSSAKLIALTGWGQPHDKQNARDAGFDHHITKPVDLDKLKSLLDSASS